VTTLHGFQTRRNQNACLFVNGPWGRTSDGIPLSSLTPGQTCTFYAADDNALEVYDSWQAVVSPACIRFRLIEGLATFKRFDLVRPTNQVNLTIDEDSRGSPTIGVSFSGGAPKNKQSAAASNQIASDSTNAFAQSQGTSPREVSVRSWLGDSQGGSDIDMFRIVAGNAGDSVTVRLEPDTRTGNNGRDVTLRFVGPPSKETTGPLTVEHPKTITVQLDSTGSYDIAVEAAGQGQQRYQGGYILTVESAQGKLYKLAPFHTVEK